MQSSDREFLLYFETHNNPTVKDYFLQKNTGVLFCVPRNKYQLATTYLACPADIG